MKQKIELKQVQKMTPEISYKIMQIGETFFQIEEECFHLINDEELKQKIKNAGALLRDIAEQMEDHHAERMLNWKVYIKKSAQQGFM